ncbi:hypothetical protein FISHEDRAFT_56012 [Fistulina hepatica ATCC 64428]|uniref:Uncharacterized protein n=1 Tax=Fistulina hepatica ATCC 64428 TaxID=1128425 RepID=A0A0D7ALS9_9AGAR|nr:hypothetical protein FISHEDRAFT_56012 [Fistulina hepatica ATCC 64428]
MKKDVTSVRRSCVCASAYLAKALSKETGRQKPLGTARLCKNGGLGAGDPRVSGNASDIRRRRLVNVGEEPEQNHAGWSALLCTHRSTSRAGKASKLPTSTHFINLSRVVLVPNSSRDARDQWIGHVSVRVSAGRLVTVVDGARIDIAAAVSVEDCNAVDLQAVP